MLMLARQAVQTAASSSRPDDTQAQQRREEALWQKARADTGNSKDPHALLNNTTARNPGGATRQNPGPPISPPNVNIKLAPPAHPPNQTAPTITVNGPTVQLVHRAQSKANAAVTQA